MAKQPARSAKQPVKQPAKKSFAKKSAKQPAPATKKLPAKTSATKQAASNRSVVKKRPRKPWNDPDRHSKFARDFADAALALLPNQDPPAAPANPDDEPGQDFEVTRQLIRAAEEKALARIRGRGRRSAPLRVFTKTDDD